MSSVLHLIPKKPRKDLAKLFFNEGKVCRFTMKFSGEVNEEDTMRRFVVNYSLFDDELMIHEPPQRNLGIVTGRFLEKGVHLNQVSSWGFSGFQQLGSSYNIKLVTGLSSQRTYRLFVNGYVNHDVFGVFTPQPCCFVMGSEKFPPEESNGRAVWLQFL